MKQTLKLTMLTLAALAARTAVADAPPEGPPPAVRIELVHTLDKSVRQEYVGSVGANATVHIVPRVSGTLEKMGFREGGMVKEGDLLFEIEDTIYRANVDAAQAVLDQTEAELAYAQKEHDRYAALLKNQATAETTYNNTLRAQKVYAAKLHEAKAALTLAKNDLDYTRIHSPLTGRIGESVHSTGNYITPGGGKLASIVQLDPIKIKFSISERIFFRYFRNYEEMVNAELSIIRANDEPYKGEIKLDFVDNMVDTSTGTIAVQLECSNPDMQLIPGGWVRVQLAEKFDTPRLAIGVSGIMTDGKQHYCYVVGENDQVERRTIVIGPQVRNDQIVDSGLEVGERVVVGGLNKIRPGMKVTPVAMESAAAGSK